MSMIDDIKRDREAGTPGPWAVCGDGARVKPVPHDQWLQPIADVSSEIRWDNETWGNLGRVSLNARRIARVPDMEAALIEAMEALKALVSANNSTDGMAMRKAWDKADAAIARAKPAPTETRVQCYRGEYYKRKEHGTCIKNPDGSLDWASWKDAE